MNAPSPLCRRASALLVLVSGALGGCSLLGLFDLPPAERCTTNGDCRALISLDGADPCAGFACLSGACLPVAYRDLDGDGFSPEGCAPPPPIDGRGGASGDCNDDDATTYPQAVEVCDLRDNDCDGRPDQGALELVDPLVVQAASSAARVPGFVAAASARSVGTGIVWVDRMLAAGAGPAHATVYMGAIDGPARIDGVSTATTGLDAVAMALAPYPGIERFAGLVVSTSGGCAPLQNGPGGALRLLSLPDPIDALDVDLLTQRCADGDVFDAAVHASIAVDSRADGPVGAIAYLRQRVREQLGDRSCVDVGATEQREIALYTFRFGRTQRVDAPGDLECGRMPVADGGTAPRISACREAEVPMPAVYQATYADGCVCRGEGFGMFAESTAIDIELEPIVVGSTVGDDAIALAPISGVGFLAAWPVVGGALELRRIVASRGSEASPTIDGAAIATLPATAGPWSSARLIVLDGSPSIVFLVAARGCATDRRIVLVRGELDGGSLVLGQETILAGAEASASYVTRHDDGVLAAWLEGDRLAGTRVARDGTLREDRLALTPDRVSIGSAAAIVGEDGTASMALAVLSSEDPVWTPGVSIARLGCGP